MEHGQQQLTREEFMKKADTFLTALSKHPLPRGLADILDQKEGPVGETPLNFSLHNFGTLHKLHKFTCLSLGLEQSTGGRRQDHEVPKSSVNPGSTNDEPGKTSSSFVSSPVKW